MTETYLSEPWQSQFLSTRMAPNMAQNDAGRRLHTAFNKALRALLLEAQEANHIIDKDELHMAAAELLNLLREDLGDEGFACSKKLNNHETARAVDNILENMIWTDVKSEGRCQILGTINELDLPAGGVDWILESLPGYYDETWRYVFVVLADVACDHQVDRSWIPRLAAVAKRQSRAAFGKYADTVHKANSGFRYRLEQRIKDWFIIRIG